MGTTTSSSCKNLLLSDDACEISSCVKQLKVYQESGDITSYLLQLKSNTKFVGKPIKKVLYSLFFSSTQQQYLVRLCSFIRQASFQNICPFLTPVYAIGYNCAPPNNTLPKNNSEKKGMAVVHGLPPTTTLKKWSTFILNDTTGMRDYQLVLFQLLYTCYLLEKGNFFYGLHTKNLFVRTLKTPKRFLLIIGDLFFEFSCLYEVQVGLLPLNFPLSNDMSFLAPFFKRATISLKLSPHSTLLLLASELKIQGKKAVVTEDVMGMRDSFLLKQNIQPFSFHPNTMDFTTKENIRSKPQTDPALLSYRDMLQKQVVVRNKIKTLVQKINEQ